MAGQIVIVGAGQAGFACAAKLRQQGFAGSILMFGDEGIAPYQRPPLSKAYLLGKIEADRLSFRLDEFYSQHNIELHTATRVAGIDVAAREVITDRGRVAFDHLLLATGARPVELPQQVANGVENLFYLRTKSDADRLRPVLNSSAHILVAGGGYIGLEVAAAARQAGAQVTLVEMAPRILARVAAEPTADYFRKLHSSQGVDIREAVGIASLSQNGSKITAALTDSSSLDVDAVVVGIGVKPNAELASHAGLAVNGGVVVDQFGRTSSPHIWAAGDCAVFPYEGELTRIESVPHAIAQAENVAMNMLGEEIPYLAKPWFWSDQFSAKLQIAGLNRGFDRTFVSSNEDSGALTVSYYKNNGLIAVDCLNDARAFMTAKRELGV